MKHNLRLLTLCLTIKSLLVLLWIHLGAIGLGPDEAQYWTWSQQIDWGYYSKPPGVAWQIALGTHLLGNTELGVRLMSVVISFALALAVYGIARACRLKKETAFWAGIVMGFTPLGVMSSILATTDGGMVLSWALATGIITRALSQSKTPNYYTLGLLILLGALFKWPIYIFWTFVLLAAIVFPELRSKHLFGGIALSLLGLLPSILWNASHDWATFQHVYSTIVGGHGQAEKTKMMHGNFPDFIGAQASLFSPILFILFILALIYMLRNITRTWPSILFCGMMNLVIFAIYSTLSLFQKIQGNWCVYAYPSAIVLLCWYTCERVSWGKTWLKAGIALSIILTLFTLTIPLLPIPYRFSPFRHNVGWQKFDPFLTDLDYDPEQHFLFSDKYQTTSILSFYAPGQNRAYFLNLLGTRKNQFSYWPGMPEEQLGKNGFFIITENAPHLEKLIEKDLEKYSGELQKYFASVKFLGVHPLVTQQNQIVKGAAIFFCSDYNGKTPSDPNKY